MSGSAIELSRRDAKRRETEDRISDCAQRLVAEHGLDGFTMEDLAAAADVSRRTLFNYFPSKVDAVLGNLPTIPADVRETFVRGGPHGALVEDLAVLARVVLADTDLQREQVDRLQHILTTTPRLAMSVHCRFEEVSADIAALVAQRDPGLTGMPARLLVRLLVTVFDSAMAAYVAGDDRPLADLFDEHLAAARRLLA
ncbi:TetR family transcriptional regulator [Nocardioides marmotae]|nr:TetR family transcriptional regulator [Nocardioides marmotae]MBC9732322.1 TetR family transcriptional regulator [Nocardioides marmotae]MTB83442.1 TetR family transcriptional regulator [Nocardioides marmotae]QKD99695.1 TetR family transcriptional regulator [Nocardioides marmotae]